MCEPPVAKICVLDGGTALRDPYTRESLQQTLSFMGCKSRHAYKVAFRCFDVLDQLSGKSTRVNYQLRGRFPRAALRDAAFDGGRAQLTRAQFMALVAWALADYKYSKPDQMHDMEIACRREDYYLRRPFSCGGELPPNVRIKGGRLSRHCFRLFGAASRSGKRAV